MRNSDVVDREDTEGADNDHSIIIKIKIIIGIIITMKL